jgi:hypothetical protein
LPPSRSDGSMAKAALTKAGMSSGEELLHVVCGHVGTDGAGVLGALGQQRQRIEERADDIGGQGARVRGRGQGVLLAGAIVRAASRKLVRPILASAPVAGSPPLRSPPPGPYQPESEGTFSQP